MPCAQAFDVVKGKAMNDEQGLHQIDTEAPTPDAFDRIDYYLTKAIEVMLCIGVGMFLTAAIIFWGTT